VYYEWNCEEMLVNWEAFGASCYSKSIREREREREREKESVWKKKDNAESVIGKQIAEKAEC
jgi:hypothetical protein